MLRLLCFSLFVSLCCYVYVNLCISYIYICMYLVRSFVRSFVMYSNDECSFLYSCCSLSLIRSVLPSYKKLIDYASLGVMRESDGSFAPMTMMASAFLFLFRVMMALPWCTFGSSMQPAPLVHGMRCVHRIDEPRQGRDMAMTTATMVMSSNRMVMVTTGMTLPFCFFFHLVPCPSSLLLLLWSSWPCFRRRPPWEGRTGHSWRQRGL